jgi:hypothetical protein
MVGEAGGSLAPASDAPKAQAPELTSDYATFDANHVGI